MVDTSGSLDFNIEASVFMVNPNPFVRVLVAGVLSYIGFKAVRDVRSVISIPTAVYGPSKPGEPPHKDTGWLTAHVYWKLLDGYTTLRIGIKDTKYANWLEKTRPFFKNTIAKSLMSNLSSSVLETILNKSAASMAISSVMPGGKGRKGMGHASRKNMRSGSMTKRISTQLRPHAKKKGRRP